MPFITRKGLKYFAFDIFSGYPIVHGVFSRHGGISRDSFHSLNLGGNLGDLDENIIVNKKRIFDVLDIAFETQFDVWQVHGTDVAVPETPRKPLEAYLQADAIITNKPDFSLVMRFADCVPILLYDPTMHIVGIVHAGWQGTVKNTINAAINKMKDMFGVNPENIRAGIGPSIGPDHYTIHEDVQIEVQNRFGQNWKKMIQFKNGKIYFDLWAANEINLQESGVTKIEIARICTACQTDDWFSHRAEAGKTGRFGAVIKLLA